MLIFLTIMMNQMTLVITTNIASHHALQPLGNVVVKLFALVQEIHLLVTDLMMKTIVTMMKSLKKMKKNSLSNTVMRLSLYTLIALRKMIMDGDLNTIITTPPGKMVNIMTNHGVCQKMNQKKKSQTYGTYGLYLISTPNKKSKNYMLI